MKLCCIGHTFRYETEKICRLFLPFEKIEVIDYITDGDDVAVTRIDGKDVYCSVKIGDSFDEGQDVLSGDCDDREKERRIAALLFLCFSTITAYKPRWGIVTGIRPTRLYSLVLKEMGSKEKAKEFFSDSFFVDDEKIELCDSTYKAEEDIISCSKPNSFSLYISIPFCPTRCSYCSFVSHSIFHSRTVSYKVPGTP